MAGFKIDINKEDLANVQKTLRGVKNGYEKVVVGALNKTIGGVKTDTVAEISNIITPTKTIIRRSIIVEKASYNKLSAAVRISPKGIPLIAYRARTTKKGVTAQIYKKSKRTLYPFCFIATMKSGHKGVFSREKPPYKSHTQRKLPWIILGRKYRLPINQKFGPMAPDIAKRASVMNPILAKAGVRLKKEIDVKLNHELSKL